MYEFTCGYCGTVKIVKYKGQVGKFCSRACANKDEGRRLGKVDLSYDWKGFKRGNQTAYVCRYNSECSCIDRNCAKCGWNPEVAKSRLVAILEKKKVATG